MTIATWQPGTVYLAGQLVVPTTVAGATATVIVNPDFELGDSDWSKGTGWAINGSQPWAGSYSAEFTGNGTADLISSTKVSVAPGKAISAQCYVRRSAAASPNAAVLLQWYDAGDNPLSQSVGNAITTGAAGVWKASTVTAVAPPNAAKVAIGATAVSDGTALYVDNFQWDYVTGVAPNLLVYKAIPDDGTAGTSGATEPTWPTSSGGTVVDNNITWEAQEANTVTWQASSVLTSGASEPTWPEESDAVISDNNIAWVATPLRITDPLCPHTKVVAIAASKVFAAGTTGDVVRFCATLNARDWSTEYDAGFLPTGLQQKSQVGVDVMNVYRSNLTVWSGSNLQVWQVDPDPSAMQLLDSMEGVGSIYQQAAQPVSDDLFFLAALGVRTVSVAAGAENLSTGDVGKPIDPLIQAELGSDVEPHATYYPSAGQYWLAFRNVAIGLTLLASEFLLTSPLYPIEFEDALVNDTAPGRGRLLGAWSEDALQSDGYVSRITNPYVYQDHTFEEAIASNTAAGYGTMGGDIVIYSNAEDAIINSTTQGSATLVGALVVYDNTEDALQSDTSASRGDIA